MPGIETGPLRDLPDEWKRYEPNPILDWSLFLTAFIGALVVYGYPLFNFSLHIDGEMGAVFGTIDNNIALGRWGISLVRLTILPDPFVPFFTPMLSILLYVASAVVVQSVLPLNKAQRFIFVLFYVAFPQFSYQLEFPVQSDCIALGMLCAAIAYLMIRRAREAPTIRVRAGYLMLSLLLCTFAISVYQSIIFFPICTAVLYCTTGFVVRKEGLSRSVRECMVTGCVCFVSFVLYSFISKLIQSYANIPASDYLSADVGWGKMPIRQVIDIIMIFVYGNLKGSSYYGSDMYSTVVFAIIVFFMNHAVKERNQMAYLIVCAVFLIATVFIPFLPIILLGQNQTPRVFITEQISFAGAWTIALEFLSFRTELVIAAAVLALLSGSLHASRLFFSDHMSLSSDTVLATRIIQQIYRADPAFDDLVTPVYFHGGYAMPNIWRGPDFDVFGNSFFSWDNGRNDRIDAFFKASGIAGFKPPSQHQIDAIQPVLKAMPTWPNPASVRLLDGVMIVNLGA